MNLRLDDKRYNDLKDLIRFAIVLLICNMFLSVAVLLGFVNGKTAEAAIEAMPVIDIVVEEEKPTVNQQDLELLACVIYQEAGGNAHCDDCRRRVADVVLNRVNDERFPNDIHSVLVAPRQYGRFSQTGVVWPERAKNPYEAESVARAYRIAEEVLLGNHSELYGQGYIWQAEFKQGKEQFYHCGHYFGR